MSKRNYWIFFTIILTIATVLRLYQYTNIPYTHDEYSAINRTQFDTFDEVIEQGVMVEGHPAGVQLFIYYYVKAFGAEPWVVRIPFVLMGILSVVLIMLIGRNWFSMEAGLFAGAIAATTQYFIFHSLVARPYSPGLFFVLLMLFFLQKIINNDPKAYVWILFTLSIAATPYVHYFAAFTAFVIYLLGATLIPQKRIIKYGIYGAVSLLLFFPHLNIFLSQITMKGIGDWLPIPTWGFLFYYFEYAFHFTFIFIILFVLLLVLSLFRLIKNGGKRSFFLPPVVWIVVYITAFFYSISVSSVLQISVMLFAFPGMLWFAGDGIRVLKSKIAVNSVVGFALLIGIFSLFVERKHYQFMKNELFSTSVNTLCKLEPQFSKEKTLFVSNHRYIPQLLNADDCAAEIALIQSGELYKLQELINSNKFSSVALMLNGPLVGALPMVANVFPNHITFNRCTRGEFHFFSKEGINNSIEWDTLSVVRFDQNTNAEFVSIGSFQLDTLTMNSWSDIDIVFTLSGDSLTDEVHVVSELQKDGKTVDWRGTKALSCGYNPDSTRTIYHSLFLQDIHYNFKDLTLKTYVYNPTKVKFNAFDALVLIRMGNQNHYSLAHKILTE